MQSEIDFGNRYTYNAAMFFTSRIEAEVMAIGLAAWLKDELYPETRAPIQVQKPKYRPAKRTRPKPKLAA